MDLHVLNGADHYHLLVNGTSGNTYDLWFDDLTGDIGNCCDTTHGAGCTNSTVETGVCAVNSACCSTNWDSTCVGNVESLALGLCS